MRTVAFSHLPGPSGPMFSLRSRLEWLASMGSLELVTPDEPRPLAIPANGATRRSLPYSPLTLPRSLGGLRETIGQMRREVEVIRRYLRESSPDLVIVASTAIPAALIASRLERCPTICYVGEVLRRGTTMRSLRSTAGVPLRLLVARCSDALLCCSEIAASGFRGFEQLGWTRVLVSYPPVELEAERRKTESAQMGAAVWQGDGPLITSVGTISRGRGQDTLIHAFVEIRSRFPDARLAIVGAPHAREADLGFRSELSELVEALRLGDQVFLTGHLESVGDILRDSDVVVNPAKLPEALGRVALEALACGTPVVSTRVGGVTEVLEHEADALLVSPADPVGLAAAIIRLLSSPELAADLAEAGRRKVARKFNGAAVMQQFRELMSREPFASTASTKTSHRATAT